MLKFKGIKKVASESNDMEGRHTLQVNYNMLTDEVWEDQCVGNRWVRYNDEDIICAGHVRSSVTMNELKDMIRVALSMAQ